MGALSMLLKGYSGVGFEASPLGNGWLRSDYVYTVSSKTGEVNVGDLAEFFFVNNGTGYATVKAKLDGDKYLFSPTIVGSTRFHVDATGVDAQISGAHTIIDLLNAPFSTTIPLNSVVPFSSPFGGNCFRVDAGNKFEYALSGGGLKEISFWMAVNTCQYSKGLVLYNPGDTYAFLELLKTAYTSPARTGIRMVIRPTGATGPMYVKHIMFTSEELNVLHHYRILLPSGDPPELWIDGVLAAKFGAGITSKSPTVDTRIAFGACPIATTPWLYFYGGFDLYDFRFFDEIVAPFTLVTEKQWP